MRFKKKQLGKLNLPIKVILKMLYVSMLLYLSLEILFRRFIWKQIPTQISAFTVYAILLLNGFVIYRFLFQAEVWGWLTKREKN